MKHSPAVDPLVPPLPSPAQPSSCFLASIPQIRLCTRASRPRSPWPGGLVINPPGVRATLCAHRPLTRTVAAIVGPVGVGGHASDTSEESLLPSLALPRHHLTHGESHIMKQDLAGNGGEAEGSEKRKYGSVLGGLGAWTGEPRNEGGSSKCCEQRVWEPSGPGHPSPGRTDFLAPRRGLGYVWDYLAVQQINSRVPDSNNISLGLQTSPTLKSRLPHHLCHIRVLWR